MSEPNPELLRAEAQRCRQLAKTASTDLIANRLTRKAEKYEAEARKLGPQGQKRPPDLVGNAVHIGGTATGELEDSGADPAKAHHSRSGKKGGAARAAMLTPERRSEIAKQAAKARWRTTADK